MLASAPWGLWCGVAGSFGAGVWVAADALDGQRAKEFDTWLYGVVKQRRRPSLFRFVLAARWTMAAFFAIAATALVGLAVISN